MRAMKMAIVLVVAASLLLCSFLTGAVATGVALRYGRSQLATVVPVTDGTAPPETQEQFRIFWEVWRLAHEHYFDETALDDQRMTYGAIQGMLDTLGDEGHTRFHNPRQAAQWAQELAGEFSGIGAYVEAREGRPVIVSPIEGTPAERAGLQPCDIVLEVDGTDTADMPLDEVINRIKGQEGTQVTLTLLRPKTEETLTLTLTRARITIPAVSWVMLPGTTTAYVRISQFSANATRELEPTLEAAKRAGATGLVLDLRNNPGGYLNEALTVTGQFLAPGKLVLLQRERGGKEIPYTTRRGGRALDLPMVVLINQGSASAAEITAGALQFHQRAKLIGVTTFGTGTVLTTYKLSDGSELVLGTGAWLTPGGRTIRRQGIEPDVRVELPEGAQPLAPSRVMGMTAEELQAANDVQMLEALRVLNDTAGQ